MYHNNDLKGKPTLSVLDVALDYISRGWNPVPIKYREKRPIHDGWQKIVITAETAPQYFNGGNLNIGIQAGPHSRGLSDNDRDWPQAIVISPYIMPPTRSVFGRPSKRNSHALYYSPDLAGLLGGAALQRRHPATKEMIVELRAGGGEKGAQTVFPPSIHKETGEQISWEEDGEPATVDGATLIRCANEVAAYSLIARHWHGTAGRHHSAQVAGRFLARVGKSTAEIKLIVEAIAKAANDPEWREQVRTAADAADACAKGGNTYGYPALKEWIGDPVARAIGEWLGYRGEAATSAGADIPKTPEEWPEPTPLPSRLSPVPKLDPLMLPDKLVPWLEDIADRMQVPLDFVGVPAMAVFGSVIGCKVGIRPKQEDDWTEVANVWAIIIARPGFMIRRAIDRHWPQLDEYVDMSGAMSIGRYFTEMLDPSMNWDDVAEMVRVWSGHFCLKGIMSVADAKRAVDIGCTGIILSNHGGRQLDGSRAAFDQLAEIVDAVGDKIDVMMDGGVRRGTHVLKALSLGAKAVGVGRYYLFPLAAAGQAGVEQALSLMRTEIERDMKLMGCSSISQLSRGNLRFR